MVKSLPVEMKPALLLLVHRIPYPPNKGDKIRSYHLLRHLSKRYRVFLGAFIDDTSDDQYRDKVRSLCAEAFFINLSPVWRKVFSLSGFLSAKPLTLPFYANTEFQNWVDKTIAEQKINHAIAFSSAMALFLLHDRFKNMYRLMDFIDIDSDKWAQYAKQKQWPMNWVYQREAKYLLKFEKKVATEFNAGTFVSDHEARMFQNLAPNCSEKISAIYNGVDVEKFSPSQHFTNPFSSLPNKPTMIVFVGAMDYWPNVDAVIWFVNEVMPKLKDLEIHFCVVGSNPTKQVIDLGDSDSVSVTGRVDDVRKYIAHADICVAPLRIARGIQNKVLENLSMEKPTVVTSAALEGIPAIDNEHLLVADCSLNFAKSVKSLIKDKDLGRSLARSGRHLMISNFSWESNLDNFFRLLESKQ